MLHKVWRVLTIYTSSWSFWWITGIATCFFVLIPVFVASRRTPEFVSVVPQPVVRSYTALELDFSKYRTDAKKRAADLEADREFLNKKLINNEITLEEALEAFIEEKRIKQAIVTLAEDIPTDWSRFDSNAEGVRLHRVNGLRVWDVLEKMPHLKSLDMQSLRVTNRIEENELIARADRKLGFLPVDDLQNLSRLTSLTTLILPQIKLDQKILKALQPLEQLNWLDVSNSNLSDGLESLPVLMQLETLHIRSLDQLTQPAVSQLKKFPRLRTLIIDSAGPSLMDTSSPPIFEKRWEEQCQQLNSLPHLRSIYFADNWYEVLAQQDTLSPHITLYHTHVDRLRLRAPFMVLLVLYIVTLAIGTALVSQFSRPEAHIIPHYAAAHLSVSALFFLIAIGVGTCIISLFHINLFTACMIAICGVSPVILKTLPRAVYRYGPYATGLIPFVYLYFLAAPPSILLNHFLAGNMPMQAGLLGLAGLAILMLAHYLTGSLYHTLVAVGMPTPIMGLADMQRLQRRTMDKQAKNRWHAWGLQFKYPLFLDFKKMKSASHRTAERTRFRIWRLAGGHSCRIALTVLIVILLFVSLIWIITFEEGYMTYYWFYQELGGQVFAITYMVIPLVFANWWQRMPMLTGELSLPITRKNLLRNIYRGLFFDLLKVCIVMVVFISPALLLTHFFLTGVFWLGIYFATAAAAACLGYGFALWSFLLRKPWQLILLGIAYLGTPTALTIVLHVWFQTKNLLQTVVSITMLIGFLLIILAQQRWKKLEFARLL